MYFVDVSIHFSRYFGRHDKEGKKLLGLIQPALSSVEESFLLNLPKKTQIANLQKLNINFGPKDSRERDYWECDGIGHLNKCESVSITSIIQMDETKRRMWAIELIEGTLLQLATESHSKEAIRISAEKVRKYIGNLTNE